jgi:hypothetical protein
MSEIGTCRTSKFAVLEFTKNIKALEATPKAASVKSTPVVQKAQATPAPAPSAPSSTASIDLESLILQTLAKDNVIHDTWEFASQHSVDHQVVIGQVKSLLADNYVRDEAKSTTLWSVSEEGESILNSGSPEYQVLLFSRFSPHLLALLLLPLGVRRRSIRRCLNGNLKSNFRR